MADITMCCTEELCPNAEHCYRIQAKKEPFQHMQAFKYTVSVHGTECDNYIPMQESRLHDPLPLRG